VSYVDAGYVVTFAALSLYTASLVLRRRRLLRAVALARRDPAAAGTDHKDR
jgi:heme exporter protein D